MSSGPSSLQRWVSEASRRPGVALFAFGMLAVFCAIELVGPLIQADRVDARVLGDFAINLSQSQATIRDLAYPPHFYYPPPFLVLADAMASLGLRGAASVGLPILFLAALAAPLLALDLLGPTSGPRRLLLAVLTVAPVLYYVQWDLRATNSNLFVLSCVLAGGGLARRGRTRAAGGLLALAIALKLYSVVLLPYLLWQRRDAWLASTIVWLALLFLLLPVLRFGPAIAFGLTWDWIETFGRAGDPALLPDYYKSLGRSLLLVLGDGAGVRALTRGLFGLWIVAVAFALWRGRGRPFEERVLRDFGVLLLLPLPLSPTFQPHHAVVALLASVWGVAIALDVREPRARRWGGIGLLVAAWLLVKWVDDWPARALAIHAALGIYLVLLAALARRAAPTSSGAPRATAVAQELADGAAP